MQKVKKQKKFENSMTKTTTQNETDHFLERPCFWCGPYRTEIRSLEICNELTHSEFSLYKLRLTVK